MMTSQCFIGGLIGMFTAFCSAAPGPMYLQAGEGAVARSRAEKQNEFISSKDFGARCDGENDDTRALQSAINATPSGGVLRVVAGNCKVTGLIINKPITILGDGFGALSRGKFAGRYLGGTQLSPYGAVDGYLVSVELGNTINDEGQLYGVNMSGIYFEGGRRVAKTGGLQLSNLDHSYFHNLKFESFQRPAISLSRSVRETTFNAIATKFCGNNTVAGYDPVHNFPSISIVDTGNGDGTNQIKFTNTNIVYSLGDSVVIDSIGGAFGGVRQITFRDTMFHGLLPAMATQIPSSRGVITPRQMQFSHVISAADKVNLLGGNMTFMGSDTPAIIQQSSTDGANKSPRMRVTEYWLQARFNNSIPTDSAFGVFVAAGYASLSNMLIADHASGVVKTLSGTTLDIDWSSIDIGTSPKNTSSIQGVLADNSSSFTGQSLDKLGMTYTYGRPLADGRIPDGSKQTSTINLRVSNDTDGVFGGQLGFTSNSEEQHSQPWWRANTGGVWGTWRKVATENAVINIVPITSYEVVSTPGLSRYRITKAMNYFSGKPADSFLLELPPSNFAMDGITVTVVSSQRRSAVTWSAFDAEIVGAPAVLEAGAPIKLQYLQESKQWWITQ